MKRKTDAMEIDSSGSERVMKTSRVGFLPIEEMNGLNNVRRRVQGVNQGLPHILGIGKFWLEKKIPK